MRFFTYYNQLNTTSNCRVELLITVFMSSYCNCCFIQMKQTQTLTRMLHTQAKVLESLFQKFGSDNEHQTE